MKNATILLVDDHAETRQAFVDFLCHVGYVVVQARHGEEGLHLLQKRGVRPDLILTDLEMPRLDGVGLIRAIQADPALAGIPVVLSSGRTDAEQIGAGLGVPTFMKGRRLSELRELVQGVLSQKSNAPL